MNKISKLGKFHFDRNSYILGGEPMIFHCHHYNCFFQLSLEQTNQYIDVFTIFKDSAQELAYSQLKKLFSNGDYASIESKKKLSEELFAFCGFGRIDLSDIDEQGGKVDTKYEHYGKGWLNKFGKRNPNLPGVGYFSAGYLAGAIEAIYGLPNGTLETDQSKCLSKGDVESQFKVSARPLRKMLSPSPTEGRFQTFKRYSNPSGTNVDYVGIRKAILKMPLYGDDDGMINAFDVLLTRHFANYYSLVTIRVLLEMEKMYGEDGVNIVKELLVEAGHVCSFYTFGGIIQSAEWEAMVMPMIKSKEDWVHGIIACANAFGWGRLYIKKLNPSRRTMFEVVSGYESNSILEIYGLSENPLLFLMEGGLPGVMNLLYNGDITQKPILDEAYYQRLKRSGRRYTTVEIPEYRGNADDKDRFVVER